MNRALVIALPLGVALAIAIALWCGFDAVGAALARAGWPALLAMTAFHLVPKALCGAAWWTLLPRGEGSRAGGLAAFAWFRWLRDGANDLLGVIPGAGEIASIRAMCLRGITLPSAIASTVVDLTVEMAAQCLFIALVLALMLAGHPGATVVGLAAVGLGIMSVLLTGLIVAQRLGWVRVLDRMVSALSAGLGARLAVANQAITAAILRIHRERRRVAGALALHLGAWILGVGEGWIGLALMGPAPAWHDVLLLETCAFVLRSVGFMLPGAIGIQEGGYVLIAPLIGIAPEAALALSLLKRGREFILGAPACLAWQAIESGRRRRRAAAE
jgi:putative membrane protein